MAEPSILIVAGEASGDMHGAGLVREIHSRRPDVRFSGMGGRDMADAGVTLLYDAAKLAVVGVTEVLAHLGDILKARRVLIRSMQQRRPDLVILIDYPDFNLLLARKAKQLGIPVFYYISPQVWAWRQGRVKTIGRLTDRVGVILPFEQDFYARHGVAVDFVGHPLMDTVRPGMSASDFRATHKIEPDAKVVGLLPGSRRKEIGSLLPDFIAAARLLHERHPANYTFVLPLASTLSRSLLDECGLTDAGDLDLRVFSEDRYSLLNTCDAALAASGTVTLELAILGVPAVVAYRVSPRTYRLGRLLIRHLRFFSLVNLIADDAVIPELLQDEVTPAALSEHLEALLFDEGKRLQTLGALSRVRRALGEPGASRRAADVALALIGQ